MSLSGAVENIGSNRLLYYTYSWATSRHSEVEKEKGGIIRALIVGKLAVDFIALLSSN